jgi:hypothetical protein
MPELNLDESKPEVPEAGQTDIKPIKSVGLTATLAAAVLLLTGMKVTDVVTADAQAEKIVAAYITDRDSGAVKAPCMKEKEVKEKVIVDGKDTVVAPARIEPIIDKAWNPGDSVKTTGDTLQLALFDKATGKALFIKDYLPSAGCGIVLKAHFPLPSNEQDTNGVK